MKLDEVLEKFTLLFNIFGENCVVTSTCVKYSSSRFYQYIPVFVSTVLAIYVAVLCIIFEIRATDARETEIMVYNICLASRFLTKVSVCVQLLFLRRHFSILFAQFKRFESMTKSRFEMNFTNFQRKYVRQLSLILSLWLITFVVMAFISPCPDFYLSLLVIVIFARITECHMLFYLNLLEKLMSEFLLYIKCKAGVNVKDKSKCDIFIELKFLKSAHFALWEAAQTYNILFGWVGASIFLQLFVSLLLHTYWIFLLIVATSWDIIRK